MAISFDEQAAAQYLDLAPEVFSELVADGRIPGPDADAKWSVQVLEDAYATIPVVTHERLDVDAAVRIITDIRRVAEVVRAYGDLDRELPPRLNDTGHLGVSGTLPADLHDVAAKLEECLRVAVVGDHRTAEAIAAVSGEVSAGVERRRTLDLAPVELILPPFGVDNVRRAAELRAAQADLGGIIGQVREAMWSSGGRIAAVMLEVIRDELVEHLVSLEAAGEVVS
ncbi:hypothetical protein EB74_16480 [Mycobacterium sp. SWH-M5]|uniref:hypothetical protein n=1 Tax=Mycolicibacterium goodii TaxID=134601 RepID=UPI00093A874E|nr:hypothetical protein [Mycolicibacterium goodii]MBU8817552.1 hypothetical protein [Mycolicibacterium goodii]OKH62495.1 hypothetical protein EB74_16480 [Mycobacterium sp. SWH-M5]